MPKRDDILAAVTAAGEKGISAEDLAKAVQYDRKSLVFPHIFRLRAQGHNIVCVNGLYYLKSQAPAGSAAPTQKKTRVYKRRKDRNATKHEKLLAMLQDAGDQGVVRRELAKNLNIELKNLIYHIHFLRKKQGCQIECKNDRYSLKGKTSTVSEPEEATEAPLDFRTVPINFYAPVNKHARVVENLSPDNRVTYLDLLLKAKFYMGCVESLVNASKTISQIEKEASREI